MLLISHKDCMVEISRLLHDFCSKFLEICDYEKAIV